MSKSIRNEKQEEKTKKYIIKKEFKELCREDFEDPNEEFTDVLYDLVPASIIGNELKKIRGVKCKHNKYYTVEKIKKANKT